jgi:hypothetical protein
MNVTDAAVRPEIPGYEFGTRNSAVSPVTEADLRLLEQTVGRSGSVSAVSQKHADLIRHQDGKADHEYKARVQRRFVQWVIDEALRKHDRDWLNYQEEIGLRLPIRKFFASDIQNEAELKNLEGAWTMVAPLCLAWSLVASNCRRQQRPVVCHE